MTYLTGSPSDHFSDVQAKLTDLESFLETKVTNQPGVLAWQTARDKAYTLHDSVYAAWLDFNDDHGDSTTNQITTNTGGRSKPKKAPTA